MDTNGEARDIGYQENPAVTAWTVSLALPLQDEPEHQGSKEGREGIDLSLDSREPEGVAEGVGQ